MRLDKNPVGDATIESESSDFDDAREEVSSTYRLEKQGTSSSASTSDEHGDSDVDRGSGRLSEGSLDSLGTVNPKTSDSINRNRLAARGTTKIYDREAIIYELARPGQLGVVEQIVQLQSGYANRKSEVYKKSCLISDKKDPGGDGTAEERRKLMAERLREILQAVPDSLLHIMTGKVRSGDFERPFDRKPDWLDLDKYRRGQKFAQDNTFAILYAQMMTFFAVFSFEDGVKTLVLTGKSSTPYDAFTRYLSTGLRIRNWYTQNSWVKGTDAWKDFSTVRAKHSAVRKRLETSTIEEIDAAAVIQNPWCPTQGIIAKDFSEACDAPAIGQCPYIAESGSPIRPKGINQTEMALTQWGYVSLITCYPEQVGLHNVTDEELEDFCHLWRSIGFQLGIEDEYNFCRGTLEDIRQRSREFVDVWVKPQLREIKPQWEHMLRCFITGMSIILPGVRYESVLLHLTEILDMKMPRLAASFSVGQWISHNFTKFLLQYLIRIPGVSRFLNNMVNRALDRAANYTPEELEALRVKFSDQPGNNTATNKAKFL